MLPYIAYMDPMGYIFNLFVNSHFFVISPVISHDIPNKQIIIKGLVDRLMPIIFPYAPYMEHLSTLTCALKITQM